MGHSQHMDMLHGPLMGKLIMFALPIAMSSILQQLFLSANVAVVGHFILLSVGKDLVHVPKRVVFHLD